VTKFFSKKNKLGKKKYLREKFGGKKYFGIFTKKKCFWLRLIIDLPLPHENKDCFVHQVIFRQFREVQWFKYEIFFQK
jgi:hypothetical protein